MARTCPMTRGGMLKSSMFYTLAKVATTCTPTLVSRDIQIDAQQQCKQCTSRRGGWQTCEQLEICLH